MTRVSASTYRPRVPRVPCPTLSTSMATYSPQTEPSSSASNQGAPSTEKLRVVFDYPDADIIVRSSDDLDFGVQKVFLVKSSPVLDGFIQAASNHSDDGPPVGVGTPLPIVRLPERRAILHSLFTFLLSVDPVLPPTLEETMELLSVAQKYRMSHILVHIRGSISLKDPPLINENNALHVYSLAQKYGLHRETAQAARITLKYTLTIENLEGKLDIMPGIHLHKLWKYHRRVQDNLVADVDGFRESCARNVLKGLNCVVLTASKIPQWIDDYTISVAYRPSLFDLTEFQTALARHVSTVASNGVEKDGCSFCAYSLPRQTINDFWMALTTFVHANMEKVSISHVDCVAQLIQCLTGRISILHPQGKCAPTRPQRRSHSHSTPAQVHGG